MQDTGYSMPSYFKNMATIGKVVSNLNESNAEEIKSVENEIESKANEIRNNGKADEAINASGQMTATQRIEALVDAGTFCPLNSLYNPGGNKDGSTGLIKGLGRVNGKWVYIIASDNKKLAGAWVAGQADNLSLIHI